MSMEDRALAARQEQQDARHEIAQEREQLEDDVAKWTAETLKWVRKWRLAEIYNRQGADGHMALLLSVRSVVDKLEQVSAALDQHVEEHGL